MPKYRFYVNILYQIQHMAIMTKKFKDNSLLQRVCLGSMLNPDGWKSYSEVCCHRWDTKIS